MSLKLSSKAFDHGGAVPDVYSKKGGNVSPPLAWTGVPENTRSLALIVDDPDAPSGLFTHWIVYGIDPATMNLPEHVPARKKLPDGAQQGENGFGERGYGGPQPPRGAHRYFFHLYALDTDMDLPAGLSREELDSAIDGHVIEEAQLMGRYEERERVRTA
jgi:Raf kinase inhibitor-like YbhB/YbcL family protein